VWQQTDEQVFLDEEKDKQMEAIFEQSLENPLERGKADVRMRSLAHSLSLAICHLLGDPNSRLLSPSFLIIIIIIFFFFQISLRTYA
jgi:hypothetical protein